MKNKIENVKDWFNTRGIIKNSTPLKQSLKTSEEVLELQNAIVDNDLEEIKDAIGDIQVTLIGVCLHLGIDFYKDVISDLDLLKSSVYERDNFLLSSEINEGVDYFKTWFWRGAKIDKATHVVCLRALLIKLQIISGHYNLNLKECLQSAYDVISKRQGKMVNGQFVKELSNTERGDGGFGSTGK